MIKEQSNPRTLTRKVLSIKDIAYEKEIYRKMKARLL